MQWHSALFGLTVLGSVSTVPLNAQEEQDTTRLEDITVTATRVPVSARSVTSSITLLRGEDLRAQGITHVLDALRSVPGLAVVQGGSFGALTSLFMRGGESDYVQILVDGVAVNQPGGAYNLANLSTTNVDRIEIVRGPASVLYGSDATSGVVQIITRQAEGPARVSAGGRAGSYGSFGFETDLVGGTDRTSYTFAIDRFVTDGAYAFNNDYDNTVVSGRFQVRPDVQTDVALALRYRDSQFHFPTDFAGNLVDQNAFTLDEATTLSVDAGRFLTDRIEARVLLASNVSSGGTDDAQDDAADTLGFYAFRSLQDLSRQSIDARTNIYLDHGIVLTAGTQFEQQEERSFNASESEFGPSSGSTEAERSNQAYYAQALADVSGLSVVVGGRVDDNEAFGTFATYRAGVSYEASSRTKVRASIGRSFKAPTFFENFAAGFVTGNPDLDPERSSAWEVGARQEFLTGRIVVSGVYFDQSFKDLIQFTFAETPNYVNVAEAKASGLEFEATMSPIPGLFLSGSYAYLETEVVDAGLDSGEGATFVEGERLLRRPTTSFNAAVTYTGWDRGSVGLVVNHVGDRDDRDFAAFPNTPVVLPSYTTVDASARVDILPRNVSGVGVTGTLRVENLLDEKYAPVLGFPARGRTVLVGARVSR